MARNHLMTTPVSNGLWQRGLLSSVKNIAQAPPCGSIFSFCSENKNLGTGVTTRRQQRIFVLLEPLEKLISRGFHDPLNDGKRAAMLDIGIIAFST
jgi:hypothetical protein